MSSRRIRGAALVLCTAAIAAPTAQATFRDAADRPVPQPTGPVVIDRRPIVLESGGFDWADAGIGAAGAAGLVFVGGGAVLLTRRGRGGQIATSE